MIILEGSVLDVGDVVCVVMVVRVSNEVYSSGEMCFMVGNGRVGG